jgi:hypothetical protein
METSLVVVLASFGWRCFVSKYGRCLGGIMTSLLPLPAKYYHKQELEESCMSLWVLCSKYFIILHGGDFHHEALLSLIPCNIFSKYEINNLQHKNKQNISLSNKNIKQRLEIFYERNCRSCLHGTRYATTSKVQVAMNFAIM